MLALRRVLLSSLLLSPLAACEDGGSSRSDSGADGAVIGDGDVDDDGGAPGDGDGDAPGDGDGSVPGDGDGDASGDGDAGGDGDGDAGGDGDSGTVTFSCSNAFAAIVAGENLWSDDDRAGVLFPSAPAGAQARICAVPAASVPAQVTADHARGTVYFVEASQGVGEALLAIAPDAEFTPNGAAAAAPALTRVLVPGQAPVNASNAQFNLTDTGWFALSQLDQMGAFVYLRHLDGAAKRYEVAFELPTEESYLTGETFDLGARVSVVGQPATARTLAVVSQACNLEPLQPQAEDLGTTVADGCELDVVRRTGAQLDSDYADGALNAGRVFDLTTANAAATHLPPRFFCDFPGHGQATVNLGFLVGAEPELLVGASREIACILSRDRISAVDRLQAETTGGGPIGFTMLNEAGLEPKSEAFVAGEAATTAFTSVGSGVYRAASGALASEQPFASVALASDAPANGVTLGFSAGSYVEGPYTDDDVSLFELGAAPASTLTATFSASDALSVQAPDFFQVAPQFGLPNAAQTRFSFADGSADVVVIRGLSDDGQVLYERWLRPSLLQEAGGRRHAQLFDLAEFEAAFGDQATTKAGEFLADVVDFTLEFVRVTWDKEHAAGTTGRVLPLLAGYAVHVPARAYDPCPYVADTKPACTKGPRHVLLVATQDSVEMFDANTGEYLERVLEVSGADFKQVVQAQNGCLIASQHGQGNTGIFAYQVTVGGVGDDAQSILTPEEVAHALDFLPNGLAVRANGTLLIANALGAALLIDDEGPAYLTDSEQPLSGYGLALLESQGGFAIANRAAADGAQQIWMEAFSGPGEEGANIDLALSLPEQLTFSASSVGGLLGLVEAGTRELTLYGAGGVPAALASYAFPQGAGTPRGAFPLNAEGKWLVAGTDGLGVQLVDFTGAEPTATAVGELGDLEAQYISSACVPF